MTDLPAMLTEARARIGLSQSQALRQMNAIAGTNYKTPAFSRWENGHDKPPASVLVALGTVYGIDSIPLLTAAGHVHPAIIEATRSVAQHKRLLQAATEGDDHGN